MTLPDKDCMVAVRLMPDGPWIPGRFFVESGLFDVAGDDIPYEHCDVEEWRILVFADEVAMMLEGALSLKHEKFSYAVADAFTEGVGRGMEYRLGDPAPEQYSDNCWSNSHAKRVAEGGV